MTPDIDTRPPTRTPPSRPRLRCTLAALLLVSPAVAQEDEPIDTVSEQVTVTAQRVEQDLQDVPISVIAVEGEELERRAITDVQELASAAPGLVVSGQSSSNGEVGLYIRGIGSNTFGLGTESTVGYYVDGIYMPRPQGFTSLFLDLERVEVLRGPQGTLWGRNSTGGAISLVTRAPEGQFGGRLFADLGEDDGPASAERQRVYLSVTGPLSERLLARFSATAGEADDFTLNLEQSSQPQNQEGFSGRGSLTFLASEASTFTLRLDHTDDDAHNNFNLKPGDISPISTLGTLLRFYGLPTYDEVHTIAANIAPVSTYEESGISLDATWQLGDSGTTLQSLSSYREYDSERRADIDGTPLDFVENASSLGSEWYSQEIKLNGGTDRLDWIGGVYGFHEEGRNTIDTRTDFALFEVAFFASNPGLFLFNPADFCSLGFFAPTFLCGIDYYNALAPFLGLSVPGAVSTGNFFDTELETDSWAGYGQIYWHLSDRWTLTGGLRYTYDDKTHTQTTIDFITQLPSTSRESADWDALTPKVGVEFRPSEDVMVYGSVTTGFKSGGFNSISLQPSFDEETITSYEVGLKSTLTDGRLRLNGALFHYDYDDLQVAVLFPDRSTVENAAQASVDGLEVDLSFRPDARFSFDLGLSLLDDEFDEFSSQDPLAVAAVQDQLNAQGIFDPVILAMAAANVPVSDLSGNSLPRAPDVSLSAALQYVFGLGSAGSLTARGEYVYTDDVTFDPFENFVQESYDMVHAQLTWAPPGGRWFVNLYGRNLTDEEVALSEIFARVTGSLRVWAPPTQYGLQVGFDW